MSETKKVEKGCRIYVNVPYGKKELAKKLWLKYDGPRKQWYISVRNVKDVKRLDTICFLFDYIDIVGVGISDLKVEDIRIEYRGTSSELLNDEAYVKVKEKLYYQEPIKRKCVCCLECFKVDDNGVVDGKCESCRN